MSLTESREIINRKLDEIRTIQENVPVCPNINYVEGNISAVKRIQQQFYNPEVHQALTCLIRTSLAQSRVNLNETQDVVQMFQDFFKSDTHILQALNLRTITNVPEAVFRLDQVDQLINEAYVGIKYLNQLRSVTPCFKYIYTILTCGAATGTGYQTLSTVCPNARQIDNLTPYLVEESLDTAISLREYLNKLPANSQGVDTVKSIMLQLLAAVHYAAKLQVSNFPLDIVIRTVNPNSLIPVFLDNTIQYITTFGAVPVFERYDTAAAPIGDQIVGARSLNTEQNNIIQHIVSILNVVNVNLANMLQCGEVNQQFFADILSTAPTAGTTLRAEQEILTCYAGIRNSSCLTIDEIIRYFKVPYARIDTYVRSGVERIDQLRAIYDASSNQNDRFILSAIVVRYARLLDQVSRRVDDKTRRELFPGPRYFDRALSYQRYLDPDRGIIRGDLDFIQDSSGILDNRFDDPGAIRDFLDTSLNEGRRIQNIQRTKAVPDVSTRDNLTLSIANYRDLISYIYYYQTTNGLIQHYRDNVGNYREDLVDALDEAEFIKERYENEFVQNPRIIEQYVDAVTTDDDAYLVELYDIFVENVDEGLETSLENYKAQKGPIALEDYTTRVYDAKLVSLDPISLIPEIEPEASRRARY